MLYFGVNISRPAENALRAALDSGRFPHTAIIEGGSAKSRSELAKHLAAALVCTSQGEKPCLDCAQCRKALADSHADIEKYSGEKKTGAFKVDSVREIIRSARIIPNEADSKVFILEDTENMLAAAQNALLKVLEEPPKYAFFLLLCPVKTNFLPTVLSRAQVFSIGDAAVEESEKSAAALKAACAVAAAVTAPNDFELVAAAGVFEKDKELLRLSLPLMEEIFVEAMKVRGGVEADSRFDGVPERLASRLTLERLYSLERRARELAGAIEQNRNYNLILMRLCTLLKSE